MFDETEQSYDRKSVLSRERSRRRSGRMSFIPVDKFEVPEELPENEKLEKLVQYSYEKAFEKALKKDSSDSDSMLKACKQLEAVMKKMKENGLFIKAVTEAEVPSQNEELEDCIQQYSEFKKQLEIENHEWKILLSQQKEATATAKKKISEPLEFELGNEYETVLNKVEEKNKHLLNTTTTQKDALCIKILKLSQTADSYMNLQNQLERRAEALEQSLREEIYRHESDQLLVQEILQDISILNTTDFTRTINLE